jgi:hypothetical protein
MPLTFEALKGQRFRWCFGGIQILRRHWRSMLPGAVSDENRLGAGQRWAYLAGAIQWYGDLLALLFYVFLLVGAANVAFGGGLLYRKLTGFLVAAIPLLVVLGLLRAVAILRRGTGASWGEAFGAFFIWQSTSLTVARASVQALVAKEAVFLRTPKTQDEPAFADAVRGNWAECLLGLLGMAAIGSALSHTSGYGGPLLAVLLLWPTMSFLAAPWNSLSAQRAALPPDLRERRRTEHMRYGARRVGYTVGGLGLAGALAVLVAALFVPGPAAVVPPQILGPATGRPVDYGAHADSTRRSGTGPGSTSSPSSSTSGSSSTATSTTTTTTGTTSTTTTGTTTTTTTGTTTTGTTTTVTTTNPATTTTPSS